MPLELAQGIIRVRIDRQQLRAEIKAARSEIIKGLSRIRVKVDIDTKHFTLAAKSAGKQAGAAAAQSAKQAFNQGMRSGGAAGFAPGGGGGGRSGGGMAWRETSPGTFLTGPGGMTVGPQMGMTARRELRRTRRGVVMPGARRIEHADPGIPMGGPGQGRIGSSAGSRAQRRIGGSPFVPAGFLPSPDDVNVRNTGRTRNPYGRPSAMSGDEWSRMMTGLGAGAAISGGGRGGRGGGRSSRFGGGGGRGFFGNGPMGRFAGGAAFQMNPLLALSAHYGGPAGAAGAISAIGATEGVKAYAEFEDAIKWVKILQREAGATESAMARLENQARKVGRTTVYSATQAANAMATLTKRGFSAGQVEQQLPNVLNLAVAGELDIEESADIVANTQKQFQMGAEDSAEIADLLAKASLDSASDVRTLGVALSYVGPVAKSAGMSLKETLALITALEDAGLKGSRAGTGLARVIAKLANKDTEEAFRAIGVEVRKSNGEFRASVDLVGELQDALSSLPAPDKYAFFNTLFRERGGLALTAVVNQGADAIDRMAESLDHAGGTSARIAEERMNSLQKQFDALKNSAKDLGIEFGKTFGSGLTDLLKGTRKELEAIRLTLMSDADFRAEMQTKVDAINAAFTRPRLPEGGQAVPRHLEPEFVAPGHPGQVGPILGRGVGAAGRVRPAGGGVRGGIGAFAPSMKAGQWQQYRDERTAWLQRWRSSQSRAKQGRLDMFASDADAIINPGRVRTSGVFGRSGGGVGPATASGLDAAPLPGGRTGTRAATADERKKWSREYTERYETEVMLAERRRRRESGQVWDKYNKKWVGGSDDWKEGFEEDRRKLQREHQSRVERLRTADIQVEDDSPIKSPKGRSGGGNYRPELMGIQEFQRQIQLGVLDKKDKHLEQIVDNTKKTVDGIAGLKSSGSTFG